jgi:murein L,D-transpeptidase YafK
MVDPESPRRPDPSPVVAREDDPPADLGAPADAGPLPEVLLDPRLIVRKQARTLDIVSDGTTVKTYPIALGSSPTGDKQREGDGRTPEGVFYVCTKNPKSRHTAALGLSYPSLEHAERGLEDGLITKRQFRVIAEALRHYERPTWSTPLGGEIMIHGGGTEADWTQGCIALNDQDALELYNALPMGTSVEILE